MPEDPTNAGGAPGEPGQPEAGGSPTDAELLGALEPGKGEGAPDPKAELFKQLESIDPRELPDSLRTKLEAPFLSQYGKKTSDLDRERQQLLQVIERLATKNGDAAPTPDEKKQLLEEIANGNTAAIEGLVERLVQERTAPTMEFVSRNRAIQEAVAMMPELPKYEKEVGDALVQDPVLQRMAGVNNREFASRVLAGLAWRQKALALEGELGKERAGREAAVKQAVEDYKKKVAGLPSSTSRAGTVSGTPAEKTDKSLREIMAEEMENPSHRQTA